MEVNRVAAERRHALVLLIKEILSQVDECASLVKRGHRARLSRELLHETAKVLHEHPEFHEEYFTLLLSLTGRTPPKSISVSEEYETSVRNAKERFVAKIRELLRSANE